MITVLHGENVVASRQELGRLLEVAGKKEKLRVTGKEASLAKLSQVLRSQSLFGEERVVILEGWWGWPARLTRNTVKLIKTSSADVILWEGKKLSAAQVRIFDKAVVREFRLAKGLFVFLEALRPGGREKALDLLHQVLREEEAEMVFAMLERQLRLIILVKEGEARALPGWQRSRLARQAGYFPKKKLLEMYADLARLDFKRKTGMLPWDLAGALELYVYDHLG